MDAAEHDRLRIRFGCGLGKGQAVADVVGQVLTLGRKTLENLYEDQLFHRLVELRWGKAIADRHTPDVCLGRVESKDVEKVLAAYVTAGYKIDPPTHAPVIDTLIGLPARKTVAVEQQGDERHANEVPNDGGGTLGTCSASWP